MGRLISATDGLKNNLPVAIWATSKIVFLFLWAMIGFWIWQKAGFWGILPFGLIIIFYEVTDFWNQFLISKTVKRLKEMAENKEYERIKSLIFKKIWQLEVKRSPFTAIVYLLERTGFNRIPKYSAQKELADIDPKHMGKEVGLVLSLLYSVFYYLFYHARYINQIKLRGKSAKDLSVWKPFREPITKSFEEKGVFLGADIGCGDGKIINLLALYCKKENIPAVLFGIDVQPDIIEVASKKLKKNNLTVIRHKEGKISIDKLINLTKKERGPIICMINTGFENISQMFEPRSLDLIFIINAKHHLEESWDKGGRRAIERISKYWLVLEEKRCWTSLVLLYSVSWPISRVIICEGEDSILSMHTAEEWASQKIRTITAFPFLIWAMSDSLYNILEQKRGVV